MFVRIRNLREDNDKTQKEVAEYLFCVVEVSSSISQ